MRTRLQRISVVVVMLVLLVAGFALAQGKVDINKADVKGLMSLKGIGKQKAQAIVKYRQMNGPFQSLDDLQNVPGIGAKTVANNKDMIAIGKAAPGKKGAAASGKAQAKDAKKGAAAQSKKAMAGAMEKGKKGMAGAMEKAKEAKPAK